LGDPSRSDENVEEAAGNEKCGGKLKIVIRPNSIRFERARLGFVLYQSSSPDSTLHIKFTTHNTKPASPSFDITPYEYN